VDVLLEGKRNRVIGYKDGEYIDYDINDALRMQKEIPEYQLQLSKIL
jgi:6-phosphofructokinase 1